MDFFFNVTNPPNNHPSSLSSTTDITIPSLCAFIQLGFWLGGTAMLLLDFMLWI